MATSGRRETLLVVGEDLALLHLLPEAIRMQLAYVETETYASAGEAVARLKEGPVSAVVTDLSMRFGSGFVLLNQMVQGGSDTPVIAAVYKTDQRAARQAFDAGAYDILWKPLERDDVVQSVRSALSTYRLRQRLKSVQASLVRLQRLLAETNERPLHSEKQAALIGQAVSASAYSYALSKRAKDAIENRLRQREEVMRKYTADLETKIGTARRRARTRVYQANDVEAELRRPSNSAVPLS